VIGGEYKITFNGKIPPIVVRKVNFS